MTSYNKFQHSRTNNHKGKRHKIQYFSYCPTEQRIVKPITPITNCQSSIPECCNMLFD